MTLYLHSAKLQHVRNFGNCDLFSKYEFFIIKLDVKGGVATFHHAALAALQVNTEPTAFSYNRGINFRKARI